MVKDNLEMRTNYIMDFDKKYYIDAKITYCPICGNPMEIRSPRFSTHYMEMDCGKKICEDCYKKRHSFFSHTYKTRGEKENINNVERLKVELSRFFKKFHLKCYADLTSLKASGRSTFFGKENEISFECNFDYYKVPTFEEFTNIMTTLSKRAKIKDKKELLIDKKFINYLYECITYSFNIGVDKKMLTLIDGL